MTAPKIHCTVALAGNGDDAHVEICIPRRDLERALKGLSEGDKRASRGRRVLPTTRSKIYHDPEVRRFLEGLLYEPLTIDEMRLRLDTVFGVDRSPSRSAIARYARRRRIEIGF